MQKRTDYLIIGAGASAMSFVDVMLRETDATFTIVDRRHAPGGHWNDAYPFVRLHQPSAYYGVASRPLGAGRRDVTGFNEGYYELATGTEVTHYYHALMREDFLPSGRVAYHPMSEYTADGEVVHLLSGARQHVEVEKSLVDGTRFQTSIPLTNRRRFTVADGVACIIPNDLPRIAPAHSRFAVLGGGKTAIDSVSFLLANGAPPESITWVLPRDPWLMNRSAMQPGIEFFEQTIGGLATQYEIFATAQTVEEMCQRHEAARLWLRLDPNVWPTMFHGPLVTEVELEHLRRIPNFVRLGRVQRLEPGRIVLERGTAAIDPRTLFIDCTASALGAAVGDRTPVFRPGQIALQMVRLYQPTFSAAVIAHIEATISDDSEKQALTQVTVMTDTVEQWIATQVVSMTNQYQWSQRPDLRAWIAKCRLNALSDVLLQVRPDDVEKRATIDRFRKTAGAAVENLQRLARRAVE